MMTPTFELPNILMATLTLSLSALVALVCVRWLKPNSHRISRLLWLAVLLNGIIFSRFAIEVPVLDSDEWEPVATRLLAEPAGNEFKPKPSNTAFPNHEPESFESSTETTVLKNEVLDRSSAELPAREPGVEPVSTFNFPSVCYIIWLIGCVGFVLVGLQRYLQLLFDLRRSRTEPEYSQQMVQVCQELGVAAQIPLKVHPDLGPALVLTPAGYQVIVPRDFWADLGEVQRSAVLKHELAHYQRSDVIKSMAVAAIAIPHWFNPLAWVAVNRFNQAAEWACDEAVGKRDTAELAGFARALLSLTTQNPVFLAGTSGMAGADLKTRVTRLFNQKRSDTMFHKLMICVLSLSILALGWVNLRFVAAATPQPLASDYRLASDELDQKIRELSNQLGKENQASVDLAKALKTPAGRIAVSNRIGWIREDMRRQAAKDSVPEFFETQLNAKLNQRMQKQLEVATEDVKAISGALTKLRTLLNGTSEADQMFSRLVQSENSSLTLYFGELRGRMRPSKRMIADRLGEIFADNGKGKMIVRESARPRVMEKFGELDRIEQYMMTVHRELSALADEINAKDEYYKTIRETMKHPYAAAYVMVEMLDSDDPVEREVEHFFNELDWVFEDQPAGLELNSEAREHFEHMQNRVTALVNAGPGLRSALDDFIDSIDTSMGKAETIVVKLLRSNLGMALASERLELEPKGAEALVQEIIANVLEKTSTGYQVRSEQAEQVMEFSREHLQNNRRIRRHTRMLDMHLSKTDSETRELYSTNAAKLMLVEEIKDFVMSKEFDAWSVWLEEYFDETDNGYVVNESGREMVAEILQEVKEIEAELGKDDF